jgi:pimeloyl-ACP methyl ester carboxylesterase
MTGRHRGGSGEPLLLVHGFSCTWRVWEPVLPLLERDHDVAAITLTSHVDGPAFPDGVEASFPALVDAVERDLDDLGWDKAHIAGNSLGGWLSLELARRGRARSIVAVAPAGGWESGSPEEKRLVRLFRFNHRVLGVLGPRAESLTRRPRLRALLLRDLAAHPERIPPRAAAEFIDGAWRCSAYLDLVDGIVRDGPPRSFEGIDCPVRLVWGTRDRVLPVERYSDRLRRLVPAAEFVTLDGLGHVPMSDDPDLVARTILDVTTAPARTPEPTAS